MQPDFLFHIIFTFVSHTIVFMKKQFTLLVVLICCSFISRSQKWESKNISNIVAVSFPDSVEEQKQNDVQIFISQTATLVFAASLKEVKNNEVLQSEADLDSVYNATFKALTDNGQWKLLNKEKIMVGNLKAMDAQLCYMQFDTIPLYFYFRVICLNHIVYCLFVSKAIEFNSIELAAKDRFLNSFKVTSDSIKLIQFDSSAGNIAYNIAYKFGKLIGYLMVPLLIVLIIYGLRRFFKKKKKLPGNIE